MVAAAAITIPGLDLYPERDDLERGWQQFVGAAARKAAWQVAAPLRAAAAKRLLLGVGERRAGLRTLGGMEFHSRILRVREDLLTRGLCLAQLVEAFALIREAAHRSAGLSHYDEQIQAGYTMLCGGIAEQDTGEGKTLTATLPAATAALAGIPVHVITVNDYLAQRDYELMAPVYALLGLSQGLVVAGMSKEQRRAAYRCDITYCTNKEVAFDYLRDRITLRNDNSTLRIKLSRLTRSAAEPVMRGLHFAIVDEADSVLIDEARTPLIISERSDPAEEYRLASIALDSAASMRPGEHFEYRGEHQQIILTQAGEEQLSDFTQNLGGPWRGRLFREDKARKALTALHVFSRDRHYLVRDGKIEIIDENTGRVMPDRAWGDGIHQLLEVKESCPVTGQNIPLAQMTYQRFFRRYRKLSGMTGTAMEAAAELWSVYRLPVVRVRPHKTRQRSFREVEIFTSLDAKWARITERTRELATAGVPVLIGTRSVASSELASACLQRAGIPHRVLNAAQDQQEAEIIAGAGHSRQVTVATNMAGRGVDIRLSAEAIELGGLHIIMSEKHDSGRIDRQLFGRCARQGEPGCVEAYLSLEDSLIADADVSQLPAIGSRMPGHRIFVRAQRLMEKRHRRMRRDLLRWDEHLGGALSFAGRQE